MDRKRIEGSDWSYRPELDGLRAIAVVAVMLFHARGVLPGGFVGVDVFFTLSGYLVTGVILHHHETVGFTLADFWMRRIRRLMPAALLVSAASLVWGWFFLIPDELRSLAKSNLAQVALLANVNFWRESGYFADAAQTKPLLHYWSLAVEEQYYLLFPPALIYLWRWSRQGAFVAVTCLTGVSLCLCVYLSRSNSEAGFYLLPSRAWELLVGSCLAMSFHSQPQGIESRHGRWLGWIGISSLISSFFLINETTRFPGFAAVLPVAGTACVIWSLACSGPSCLRQLLSRPPLVVCGRLSYSLYLWHWPVLVGLDLRWPDAGMLQVGLALLLTAGLAWLGHSYWEEPIRRRYWIESNASLMLILAGFALLQSAASAWLFQTDGARYRYETAGWERQLRDVSWRPSEAQFEERAIDLVPLGAGQRSPDFVVWGDSHGAVIQEVVGLVAESVGRRGFGLCRSVWPPGQGIWLESIEDREAGIDRRERAIRQIKALKPSVVILAARWQKYVNPPGPHDRSSAWISDSVDASDSVAESTAALSGGLRKLVTELRSSGLRVVIVRQVPETSYASPARTVVYGLLGERSFDLETDLSAARRQVDRASALDHVFDGLRESGCAVLDPKRFFTSERGAYKILENGRSLYRDSNHLSLSGVEFLAGAMAQEIIWAAGWN